MEEGQKALIDPRITGLKNWIEGIIIKVRQNPFLGTEIAVQDATGTIYFDKEIYFKLANN